MLDSVSTEKIQIWRLLYEVEAAEAEQAREESEQ